MNIKGFLVKLFCIIVLVVVSYILWDNNNTEESATLASSFNNMDVFVYVEQPETLSIISDNKALEYVDSTSLILRNKNKFKKDIKLKLLISKSSTINKKDIELAIDNNIYYLRNMEYEEDNDNYYYYLKDISIESYSSKEFETRIWIDDSISSIPENAFLTTNFIVE